MRLSRLVLATALSFALAAPALAQRGASGDLQQQMTPAEFKAAGLDKLSAAELAALNAWLHDAAGSATAAGSGAEALEQAKEAGRQEVIVKNRGFFDFGSKEPIESTLVGPFNGFAKGKRYLLANGQEWEQTESASLSGVSKDAPAMTIRPGISGVWYLQIDGYNSRAKVRRVK
jgi:hypothetical protein